MKALHYLIGILLVCFSFITFSADRNDIVKGDQPLLVHSRTAEAATAQFEFMKAFLFYLKVAEPTQVEKAVSALYSAFTHKENLIILRKQTALLLPHVGLEAIAEEVQRQNFCENLSEAVSYVKENFNIHTDPTAFHIVSFLNSLDQKIDFIVTGLFLGMCPILCGCIDPACGAYCGPGCSFNLDGEVGCAWVSGRFAGLACGDNMRCPCIYAVGNGIFAVSRDNPAPRGKLVGDYREAYAGSCFGGKLFANGFKTSPELVHSPVFLGFNWDHPDPDETIEKIIVTETKTSIVRGVSVKTRQGYEWYLKVLAKVFFADFVKEEEMSRN